MKDYMNMLCLFGRWRRSYVVFMCVCNVMEVATDNRLVFMYTYFAAIQGSGIR